MVMGTRGIASPFLLVTIAVEGSPDCCQSLACLHYLDIYPVEVAAWEAVELMRKRVPWGIVAWPTARTKNASQSPGLTISKSARSVVYFGPERCGDTANPAAICFYFQ
jgi:hypothetical protein